jgi:hypothetical protein
MNQIIKRLDISKMLFFDIRFSKREATLDNMTLRHLFQLKNKDVKDADLDALYETQGSTYLGFNKIDCIALGYVKEGQIRTKLLEGSEEYIIREFCTLSKSFMVLAGVNSIAFKLPLIIANGSRYMDMCEVLPEQFNTSGKKPWDIKFVIDITEQFKGTYYISPNLYDMCYHFSIDYDIEGGIHNDIISTIQLYARMSGNVVSIGQQVIEPLLDERNLFQKIYDGGLASNMEEVKFYVSKAKNQKLEIQAKKLILSAYVHNNFANNDEDKKEVKARKEQEVEELFND